MQRSWKSLTIILRCTRTLSLNVYGLTGELIANESLQKFITEVHRLADCWEFKEMKDRLI